MDLFFLGNLIVWIMVFLRGGGWGELMNGCLKLGFGGGILFLMFFLNVFKIFSRFLWLVLLVMMIVRFWGWYMVLWNL